MMTPIDAATTRTATCSARAALAGNPSDGYDGAVLAVPVAGLEASATVADDDDFVVDADDPELAVLLLATLDAARERYATSVPPLRLTAATSIPRSVGLAGSSALVVAALRAVFGRAGIAVSGDELAMLALHVEVDRLGIAAGPQDRLVQAHDSPVLMRFDRPSPVVEHLELTAPLVLRVEWWTDLAAPSGAIHAELRRRYLAGDPAVVDAMRALASEAEAGARALAAGDVDALGAAMDASLDLRIELGLVDPRLRSHVERARERGWWVNSAGSGGSLVMLAHPGSHPVNGTGDACEVSLGPPDPGKRR